MRRDMELKDLFPVWKQLTQEQQRELQNAAVLRHFSKGARLHGGSEDCVGLLLVSSGSLRVFTSSDEGREITLYRLFERDMCLFSASCMLHSVQFELYVEAQEDSEVYLIPPQIYKKLTSESLPVANYTNELMAARFSDVMWLLDQILNKSFDARLAAFLLEESAIEQSHELHITHEQIARHLGSAREVVTRMLRHFQSEGLMETGRGVVILKDEKRLERLAGEAQR